MSTLSEVRQIYDFHLSPDFLTIYKGHGVWNTSWFLVFYPVDFFTPFTLLISPESTQENQYHEIFRGFSNLLDVCQFREMK
jgi:hypothetical protein